MHIKNTILYCLCFFGLMLMFQCTSNSKEKKPEQGIGKLSSQNDLACVVGEFDMFSTTVDSVDNPVFGEQNIDMKCR